MTWTMARLLSAIMFCALGYYCGLLTRATFNEGVAADYFPHAIAIIGLWQGWTVLGKQVGQGYYASLGQGFRTSVQITIFGLLFFALREMFIRSGQLRYNDFGVALFDAMGLFLQYGQQFLLIYEAWMTLGLGGMVIGIVAEAAKRVWR
ncbi:MAG: TrgA family protein [Pseudomonadota bacterium]